MSLESMPSNYFIIAAILLSVDAIALTDKTYIGLNLYDTSTAQFDRLTGVLGTLDKGFNIKCLNDEDKYAIFRIDYDASHDYLNIQSVSLTSIKPEIKCNPYKGKLPEFDKLKLDMYNSEVEGVFSDTAFKKSRSDKYSLTYQWKEVGPLECLKFNDKYEGEYTVYGQHAVIVSYTFEDWKSAKLQRITKSVKGKLIIKGSNLCSG